MPFPYDPTDEELAASYYHHKKKSQCHIVWYAIPKKDEQDNFIRDEEGKKTFDKVVMCQKHKVRICYKIDYSDEHPHHCFWEKFGHFDQLSRGSNAPYNLDDYPEENPIDTLP